jgi:CubicO group peptidase (beta-lactamase class C family)
MQRIVFAVAALSLCLTPFATAQTGSSAAQDPIVKTVQPFVDDHQIAGAVVEIATRDKVLDKQAVGYANLETKKPLRADDIFWIASMTKPITATALMILVDEGKVSVDDPVAKYIPEFKDMRVTTETVPEKETVHLTAADKTVPLSHPLLIRELLSHTSGMERYSDLERSAVKGGFTENRPTALDQFPLSEAVKGYAAMPLRTQPGTQYHYSNAGMNTIGRVIEVASGMSYDKFLQTHLFDPLGMTETTFWPTPDQVKRLQTTYDNTDAAKGLQPDVIYQLSPDLSDREHRYPMPAGGIFSTADDITKFAQMILNGGVWHDQRIVSEASVKALTSKETGPLVKTSYGFGFGVEKDGTVGHGGGFKTDMAIDPKLGFVTILMEQISGNWPEDKGVKLRQAILTTADKMVAPAGEAVPAPKAASAGSQ